MDKNEAIEVLKKYQYSPEVREALECLHPELKESEDEKIRKALLNAFQESEDSLHMVLTPHRRESFIAWIKKQGEQKSLSTEETELNSLAFLTELGYTCIPPTKEKSNTWSEEDERNIRDSIFYLKSAKKYFEKDNDILWDEKWFNLCIEWLKSLKARYTWKPSDEQMRALDDVISSRDVKYNILSELWKDLKKLKG